jgi:2-haloacid dehalogenase
MGDRMVILFDLVGTLLSLDAPRAVLRERGISDALVDRWFSRLLHSAATSTLADYDVTFGDLAASSLRQILRVEGISDRVSKPLLESLGRLELKPEARQMLDDLQQRGHRLAILTNSDPPALQGLVNHNRISCHFEKLLSVAEVKKFKPHPTPYQFAAERLGVTTSDICMVAAHGWDVLGACAAGLNTLWVREAEHQWPFPGHPPGLAAATLGAVASTLDDLT